MGDTTRAAVFVSPGTIEVREFPLPRIGSDDGLLRVEACGVCGTDSGHYTGAMGGLPGPYGKWDVAPPFILGHEPVGVIEAIGAEASRRWGAGVGDRVALHAHFTCGRCAGCRAGGGEHECEMPGRFGGTSVERPPALYGAFAEHMYLPPGTILTPMRKSVPLPVAAMFNALASGLSWAVEVPRLERGQSLAVLGPGQRGIACVMAGRHSGAGFVAVTGLSSDDYKLDLAKEMGADLAIDVQREDPVKRIVDATHGGADVVVDTTPHSAEAFLQGIQMTRPGGILIVAGVKGPQNTVKEFSIDMLRSRGISVRGVTAVPPASHRRAVELIEAGAFPLERLSSHVFPVEQAEQAVLILAGRVKGERPMNIAIVPGARSQGRV